jgi:predicted protein tyrosine phosphatase
MDLMLRGLKKFPDGDFAIISIYSLPDDELITMNRRVDLHVKNNHYKGVLSLMFWDADPETENNVKHPFKQSHALEIKNWLDKFTEKDEEIKLLVHCDAGISRSGAVATFAANYLDIPFHDEYIKPNSYILRTLNNLLWSEKWQKKPQ